MFDFRFFRSWPADEPSQGPPPRVEIIPRPAPPAPDAADTLRTNIRVDSTLVLIPVTVTDPMNRFVTGLEKEHFKVQEDNVDQAISHFASEDAPLSVGIVFDTSRSMGSKLAKSRQAVAQFCRTANPADEFFLVLFSTARNWRWASQPISRICRAASLLRIQGQHRAA